MTDDGWCPGAPGFPKRRETMRETTCFIERSLVREILIGQPDENLHITETILAEIDALPILTAADINRAPAATPLVPVAWRRRRKGICGDGGWIMCPEYPGRDPEFDLQSLYTSTPDREPVAWRWRTRRHDNSAPWRIADKFSPSLMEKCIEMQPLYAAPAPLATAREGLLIESLRKIVEIGSRITDPKNVYGIQMCNEAVFALGGIISQPQPVDAGRPLRAEIIAALKAAQRNFMTTGSARESDERYADMADSMSNLFRHSTAQPKPADAGARELFDMTDKARAWDAIAAKNVEIDRLRKEIDRLTPYVEAFRREEARADKLGTEIDDLRAAQPQPADAGMREALEIIGNGGNAVFPQWRSTGPKTREQMAEIARAALAEQEKTGT